MADEKNAEERGEAVSVEFNLSDPDQLARQLDRVDLTEEESDQLLREAYKINKQLKMVRVYVCQLPLTLFCSSNRQSHILI